MLIISGFSVFGYEIKFYGIIIAFAMLVGVFLARYLAKKRNVDPDDIITLACIVLPLALIGARLYYCLFYGGYDLSNFFQIHNGGLAIYGGVIGGLLGVIIFCLIKKSFKMLPVICDILVPCLILGQALGRWGNFFNQEAYGNLVTNNALQFFPFAVFIEHANFTESALSQVLSYYGTTLIDGAYFQATFFYESFLNILGFILLLVVFHKSKKIGTTTAVYLIYYGFVRAFIEGLRTDSLYFGIFRVSQILSFVLIVIGISILVYNIIRGKSSKNSNNSL